MVSGNLYRRAAVCAVVVLATVPAIAQAKISILDSGKATTVTPGAGRAPGLQAIPDHLFHSDPADPANQFEDGELLLSNAPPGFAGLIGGLGYRIIEQTDLGGLGLSMFVLGIPSGKSVPEAMRELSGRFPAAVIDANHIFEAQARGTHARGAMGWRNAKASCGRGVRLGMIDSGVDTSHAALKGQNVDFRSFHASGSRPGPQLHGTAVAAMLVGKPRWGGLLPGAELLAASMFETRKDGKKSGTGRALLKSLNWLAQAKVHAVNLSVAGTDNKVLRLAFVKAQQRGMVLVAAAGNWGRADKPAYPAAYSDVVAVTAVNGKRLIYSHANTGSYIDFAAPGVDIFTAIPGGTRVMSGTSFASPYIAALMASEIAFGGRGNTATLRKALGRNSVDLGKPGKDTVFGYGFVDIKPKCS
ncbi:MAG: S8 family serine peptidase [Rhodospirillales bacterium]|nr:S8 family serine peptidase [Rhodospirillales bacterium]